MKNIKIFIAGHKGMVGSSLYDFLKKNNQSKQINSQNDLNLTLKKVLIQGNKSDIFIKKLNKTGNVILKNTVAEIIKII